MAEHSLTSATPQHKLRLSVTRLAPPGKIRTSNNFDAKNTESTAVLARHFAPPSQIFFQVNAKVRKTSLVLTCTIPPLHVGLRTVCGLVL